MWTTLTAGVVAWNLGVYYTEGALVNLIIAGLLVGLIIATESDKHEAREESTPE